MNFNRIIIIYPVVMGHESNLNGDVYGPAFTMKSHIEWIIDPWHPIRKKETGNDDGCR